jgi:hypothetical protein
MVTHYITFTEYLHIDVTTSVLLWLLTFPAVRIPLTRHTKTITQHSNRHKANSHWIPPRLSRLSDTFKTLLLKSYNSNNQAFFFIWKWFLFVCGCDRMVVGFTTTYVISAYHHWCCEFESRSGRGVQHYVIKFVSDLRQASGFLQVLRFPPPIKLTVTIWMKYCWKWH